MARVEIFCIEERNDEKFLSDIEAALKLKLSDYDIIRTFSEMATEKMGALSPEAAWNRIAQHIVPVVSARAT